MNLLCTVIYFVFALFDVFTLLYSISFTSTFIINYYFCTVVRILVEISLWSSLCIQSL